MRDYKKEYREYHGRPMQVKRRSQRNQARRKLGLRVGDGKEVDHKSGGNPGKPLNNGRSNLRVVSRGVNRRKGATGRSRMRVVARKRRT